MEKNLPYHPRRYKFLVHIDWLAAERVRQTRHAHSHTRFGLMDNSMPRNAAIKTLSAFPGNYLTWKGRLAPADTLLALNFNVRKMLSHK